MTALVLASWNIQAGRGCDGRLDLARIAAVLRAPEPPDLICLQEVASHMPAATCGLALDEPALLADMLADYTAIFRPAIDRLDPVSGGRAMFGCMIFSRLPVLHVLNHLLPRPPEGPRSMQRQMLEVVVAGPKGPLRVSTTHLEFHHASHRLAQVARMRVLHQTAFLRASGTPDRKVAPGSPYDEGTAPGEAIFCGDFNFLPGGLEHEAMIAPMGPVPSLSDAWRVLYPHMPHSPTCGLADRVQWPEGPHCRDFIFLTPGLAKAARALTVNLKALASDHQMLRLTLDL